MIQFRDISHTYGGKNGGIHALKHVTFAVEEGEFICLLGPSGCGKSTLLNLAAGFITPSEGSVLLNGKAVDGPGRDRAVVFQESTLFPWLTVEENIALALKMDDYRREPAIIEEALNTAGLHGFNRAMPHELSVGMKQKAAVARGLAMGAPLLLMDEPFAGLDEKTRLRLNRDIVDIGKDLKKTILFVTHSIQEAVVLGTRIILLSVRPGTITGEWPLADEGKDGAERQRERLYSGKYTELAEEIRNSMELSCPPVKINKGQNRKEHE